jgi:hypothetical protein
LRAGGLLLEAAGEEAALLKRPPGRDWLIGTEVWEAVAALRPSMTAVLAAAADPSSVVVRAAEFEVRKDPKGAAVAAGAPQ